MAEPAAGQLDGVVIGNEVLDAMPCELLHWTPEPLQRGVALDGDSFIWQDRPIQDPSCCNRPRR
jgi:SAM-dependent MidA family methyltransferase